MSGSLCGAQNRECGNHDQHNENRCKNKRYPMTPKVLSLAGVSLILQNYDQREHQDRKHERPRKTNALCQRGDMLKMDAGPERN